MPRLFIASPVPEEIRLQIEAAAAPLRSTLPSASWTRPESFHLTFAFLGEQDRGVVEPLAKRLDETLKGDRSLNVSLSDPGCFPDERRPRVAWIGLNPPQPLITLAGRVRDAVSSEKIPFDQKPWVPHLTVARLRNRWSGADVEKFRRAFANLERRTAVLDSVVLFESQLSSRGAIHTPLHHLVLSR